jgi:membrane-anchored protein YejM (alkaline phosphatase superfamily)
MPVSVPKRAQSWLLADAGVNVVSAAALSGAWLAVHEWLLLGAGIGVGAERAYLQALLVAQCAWLTASAVLAVSVCAGVRLRRTSGVLGALSFAGPGLLYVDAIVRTHAGIHLAELLPVVLDAHADDNRRILEATGIDIPRAAGTVACLVPAILLAGWFDAKTAPLGRRLSERIGRVSRARVCLVWGGALAVLASLELGASRAVGTSSWLSFQRAVPQVLGALGPVPGAQASVRVVARPPRSEAEIRAAVARLEIPSEPPGDVFFFVVDSLRGDAVDPALTPALASLTAQSLPIDVALSGGNATHLGWYSLFWSDVALAWRLETADAAEGPVPLQIARRRGWRIEVLSTPDLEYMNLGRTILGAHNRLADAVLDLHDNTGSSGSKDARVVDEVIRRLTIAHSPTVYLIFLDASHLPYSWDDGFEPPIVPFASSNHYLHVQRDRSERAAVIARYRDSLAFVDSLLGRFLAALRASGRFDDATIVVTGDHGEEFWEHGLIGHTSDLSRAQTQVTLLIKLPKSLPMDGDWSSRKALARTVDVWPTILDASGVRGDTSALFDGISLARDARRTAVIAGMRFWYASSRFAIDDGQRRALFQLARPDEPSRPQRLDALSLVDTQEMPILSGLPSARYEGLVRAWFGPDLERLYTVDW